VLAPAPGGQAAVADDGRDRPDRLLPDPPHAAHLRAALDRLSASQAVVAVVLDPAALPVLLSCDDFSADIAAHRLWVAAGGDWPEQIRSLFVRHAGLPTPSQFVRLNLPDASRLDPVIAEAQRVLAGVTAGPGRARADRSRSRPRSGGAEPFAAFATAQTRLCVVTGRRFRLWDDAGLALAGAVSCAGGSDRLRPVDADDPLTGSTLAMLESAAASGALLTADFGRADVPDLLPRDLPWATWVTTPRLPAFTAAGPNDLLVVADPAWRVAATAAGWPADRVDVGGWPAVRADAALDAVARPDDPHVALIVDTVPLDPPERLDEFSSHRLLWGAIRQELHDDPCAVGTDTSAYLRSRQRRFDLQGASLDRPLFLNHLIAPAVAQGVARRLIADGVPLRTMRCRVGFAPGVRAPRCLAGRLARAARPRCGCRGPRCSTRARPPGGTAWGRSAGPVIGAAGGPRKPCARRGARARRPPVDRTAGPGDQPGRVAGEADGTILKTSPGGASWRCNTSTVLASATPRLGAVPVLPARRAG
jgi:hypothetical protein